MPYPRKRTLDGRRQRERVRARMTAHRARVGNFTGGSMPPKRSNLSPRTSNAKRQRTARRKQSAGSSQIADEQPSCTAYPGRAVLGNTGREGKRRKIVSESSDNMTTVLEDDQIRLKISNLNPVLTCALCGGYYVTATTITTCLHTFCRSCIVRHTDFNLHCPKCKLLIHPTEPLVNLRLDCTIQDILFKLLPHLEKDEKQRERKFYTSKGIPYPLQAPTTPWRKRLKEGTRWVSQLPCIRFVSIKLVYAGTKPGLGDYPPLVNKFLRIPDYTTIGHIKRFVRLKLHVHATRQVCVFIGSYLLHDTLTLHTSMELFHAATDKEKTDQDDEALVRLNYGIVPRKNYFEYFADASEAANNVSIGASKTVIVADTVNMSNGVTSESRATVIDDVVTLDDSDDCIMIS